MHSRIVRRITLHTVFLAAILSVHHINLANAEAIELLELAETNFKELSPCEKKLLISAQYGGMAICNPTNKEENTISDDVYNEKNRQVRAALIKWLCHDQLARKTVNSSGILINGASITGNLDLYFTNINFPIKITHSYIPNPIHLWGSHLPDLVLSGSLCGMIDGRQVQIDGSVFLNNNFKATGKVDFSGASIGNNLECTDGHFLNNSIGSLNIEGINVKRSIYFNKNFLSQGEVTIDNAEIGGNLNCNGATFKSQVKHSLSAESAHIKGNVKLINMYVQGIINFNYAIVEKCFMFFDVTPQNNIHITFSNASIEAIHDDYDSWPLKGKISLDGLKYSYISSKRPTPVQKRINLLNNQCGFFPQSYEQLANVYRKHGYEDEAIAVEIAKNDALLASARLNLVKSILHTIFGLTIGYGYKPLRPFIGIILFITIGYFIFKYAFKWKLLVPTKDSKADYPTFNAFMYSVDMFIPVINFYMRDYWLPSSEKNKTLLFLGMHITITGGILRVYLWTHILFGWGLTTLFVLGFTGLIKK